MDAEKMQRRLSEYGCRIVRLVEALPTTRSGDVMADQILRAGTSVGAHYHEGCFARSRRKFAAKLKLALSELAETHYWLILLIDSETYPSRRLEPLLDETEQLLKIFVSSVNTMTQKNSSSMSS